MTAALGGNACVIGALVFRHSLPALCDVARRLARAQAALHAAALSPPLKGVPVDLHV